MANLSLNRVEDQLSSMNLLAEVLARQSLPGSFDLISQLLESINAVLHSTSDQSDADYTIQLLMSAVETASGKVKVRKPFVN
jgi:hypothetical protein